MTTFSEESQQVPKDREPRFRFELTVVGLICVMIVLILLHRAVTTRTASPALPQMATRSPASQPSLTAESFKPSEPEDTSLRARVLRAQQIVEGKARAKPMPDGERNQMLSRMVNVLVTGRSTVRELSVLASAPDEATKAIFGDTRPPVSPPAFPFTDQVFNDNFKTYLEYFAAHPTASFVWGGSPACVMPEEFPECVQVTASTDDGSKSSPGSGVIIGPQSILAAAHTVEGFSRIFVVLDCESSAAKSYPVVREPAPPPFRTQGPQWDLVILHFAEPLPADVRVAKAPPLTAEKQIDTCKISAVTAVGYGASDIFGGAGIGTRRVARGMIVLCKDCQERPVCPDDRVRQTPWEEFGCLRGMELVANASREDGSEVDTCPADSGGPMYFQDESGQFILAGIVRASRDGTPAECGYGGRYTRIDDPDVLKWIKAHRQ